MLRRGLTWNATRQRTKGRKLPGARGQIAREAGFRGPLDLLGNTVLFVCAVLLVALRGGWETEARDLLWTIALLAVALGILLKLAARWQTGTRMAFATKTLIAFELFLISEFLGAFAFLTLITLTFAETRRAKRLHLIQGSRGPES